MKSAFLTLFPILLSGFLLSEIKYESVHDETYWFPNEEFTLDGFQIGTVRSNLVWMDRMSVVINEADCSEMPKLYMTLSTSEVKKNYPDFDISSLESKFIEFGFNYDGKYLEKHEARINSAFELENKDHAVSFLFDEVPQPFLLPWEVLTIKIMEYDPNRIYFDLPERQYRMGGFLTLLLHLNEKCDKANE